MPIRLLVTILLCIAALLAAVRFFFWLTKHLQEQAERTRPMTNAELFRSLFPLLRIILSVLAIAGVALAAEHFLGNSDAATPLTTQPIQK